MYILRRGSSKNTVPGWFALDHTLIYNITFFSKMEVAVATVHHLAELISGSSSLQKG